MTKEKDKMFDSLSERLNAVLDRLTRRGALSEADVEAALREVRRALLEADVALDVARAFTEEVKKRAVGVEVIKSVTPGQMVVKIVHDQLIETLGAERAADRPQRAGAGRHHDGRLAGLGQNHDHGEDRQTPRRDAKRKMLMASLDTRRPAAMEQLAVLGRQVERRHAAGRRRTDARCRSRRARSRRRGSAAMTWCCSTPPAASPSTRR